MEDIEEEEEEEKINAFYSLVRNIRDVHNQMAIGSSNSKVKEKEKEIMKSSSWTPCFTWEDFAGDALNGDNQAIRGSEECRSENIGGDAHHTRHCTSDLNKQNGYCLEEKSVRLPTSPPPKNEEKSKTEKTKDLDLNLSL
ncbi:hypothetical protein JCGZ_14078 [Jatropha curcas]|uniref:Uncharacterized protein n=2 Tax=Jatropha curcas TaxID=180498 RepID=A0A067JWR0_JATCU|nr:hypothetical protein JCGZ_14078 [Jatropha curcas]